jgi:hypothetical protein
MTKGDNDSIHSKSSIKQQTASALPLILAIASLITSIASFSIFIFIAVTIGRSVVCGPGLTPNGVPSRRVEDRICLLRTTPSIAIDNWERGFQNGQGGGFNTGRGFQNAELLNDDDVDSAT